ncbi:MAG: hypothetical protein CMP97_06385 [Gammaproteobacteria bacterium]|nr:hypothetical protein [Gammaproteobacteria bacterium]
MAECYQSLCEMLNSAMPYPKVDVLVFRASDERVTQRSRSCPKVLVTGPRYPGATQTHQPNERTQVRGVRRHERNLVLERRRGLGKRQGLKAASTYKSVNVLEQAQRRRKNKVIPMRIQEHAVEVDLTFQTIKSRA